MEKETRRGKIVPALYAHYICDIHAWVNIVFYVVDFLACLLFTFFSTVFPTTMFEVHFLCNAFDLWLFFERVEYISGVTVGLKHIYNRSGIVYS